MSSQHLAKQNGSTDLMVEMHSHRSTALKLFSEALGQSDVLPLLDTLLILFSLEVEQ